MTERPAASSAETLKGSKASPWVAAAVSMAVERVMGEILVVASQSKTLRRMKRSGVGRGLDRLAGLDRGRGLDLDDRLLDGGDRMAGLSQLQELLEAILRHVLSNLVEHLWKLLRRRAH